MKLVHIITPFFCRKELNARSAEHFRLTISTICTAGYPFEWTIINNGSSEEIVKWLKEEVEDLDYVTRIVYNDENEGIGKGMNQGIDLGPKDYILKLDADISFYKEGWLDELVWAADNIQEAGAFGVSVEKHNYPIFKYVDREYEEHTAHIGGACFLIPKRIFDIVGYWNEDYDPYGGTDGDYGMRIRYAEYKTLYLNDKTIAKHCKGAANPVLQYDGDPSYIHFKLAARKDNKDKLDKNLIAYEVGYKSLRFVRDEKGNVCCERERVARK